MIATLAILLAVLAPPSAADLPLRTAVFHYGPTPDRPTDVVVIKLTYTAMRTVECVVPFEQTLGSLVRVSGPEAWTPIPPDAPPATDRATVYDLEKGDTLSVTVPLAQFFDDYSIAPEGQTMEIVVPLYSRERGRVTRHEVRVDCVLRPQPSDWRCIHDPKRFVESLQRLMAAGGLRLVTTAIAEVDRPERLLSTWQEQLDREGGKVIVLDGVSQGCWGIVLTRVVEPGKSTYVPVYLRRTDDCWRLLGRGEQPAAWPEAGTETFESLQRWLDLAIRDHAPGRAAPVVEAERQ